MELLRTATGKEYPCSFMGVGSRIVLFIVIDIDLNELLNVFQNSTETSVLQWIGDDGTIEREEIGYTKFIGFSLLDSSECHVRIRLEKP